MNFGSSKEQALMSNKIQILLLLLFIINTSYFHMVFLFSKFSSSFVINIESG